MKPLGLLRSLARLAGRHRTLPRQAPAAVRAAVLRYGRPRFVKSYRAQVAQEYERGRAIHRAAVRSGAFRAPEPLALLADHDLIVWEWLDGLVELRDHLMCDVEERPGRLQERCSLFERAGRALAGIHEELAGLGSVAEHWPITGVGSGDAALDAAVEEHLRRAPLRPLHWDFVCGNLFVIGGGETPGLVVLDASPNWYLYPPDDVQVACPVYVDAAVLAFSVWCHPRFSPRVAHEAEAYLDAFTIGYRDVSGFHLDRASVLACGARVADYYQAFDDRRGDAGAAYRQERAFRMQAAEKLRRLARASMASAAGSRA